MGKQKNTITLNGKVYDAKSGGLLNSRQSGSASHKKQPKTIDGVYQNPASKLSPATQKITVQAEDANTTPHRHKPLTARGTHHNHRKQERAKTLMRTAVKKPVALRPGKISTVVADTKALHSAAFALSIKKHISEDRVKRAGEVPKSRFIKRFTAVEETPVTISKTDHIPVKKPPQEPIFYHHEAIIKNSLPEPAKPAEKLFAEALSKAVSHEQSEPKKARKHRVAKRLGLKPRVANTLAVLATVFALGGFVAYQNTANIAMRVASAKSGIDGSLPGYQPAGFALNRDIQTSPGKIVINFSSNSDDRAFTITESASNWNNDTLLDSFVLTSGQSYEKLETDAGQTVYKYGDANATWIDGGIWYRIDGNSALTSNQLVQIAKSL